jgi:tetratricopeptide (TPR) repeat protein
LTVCSLLCLAVYSQGPWFDSIKQVASTQKNDTLKVHTLLRLCEAYSFSYPDTGFIYGQQAYALSEKLDYDNGRLYSIININAALYALGNYTLELDYAFRLIPLSKKMNNIIATGFSFGAVGDSYSNLGEYSTALTYYREVLKIGIKENLPELHRMYSGMAPVFLGMRQYDSASFYAQKGYALFKTSAYHTSNDWDTWWSESLVFTSLGDVFAAGKVYDSALYYYHKSLPASVAVRSKLNELTAYIGMATAFKQQHNFDSATWYAQKVLNEESKLIYPAGKQKAAALLAGMYEAQHNADSSLNIFILPYN